MMKDCYSQSDEGASRSVTRRSVVLWFRARFRGICERGVGKTNTFWPFGSFLTNCIFSRLTNRVSGQDRTCEIEIEIEIANYYY